MVKFFPKEINDLIDLAIRLIQRNTDRKVSLYEKNLKSDFRNSGNYCLLLLLHPRGKSDSKKSADGYSHWGIGYYFPMAKEADFYSFLDNTQISLKDLKNPEIVRESAEKIVHLSYMKIETEIQRILVKHRENMEHYEEILSVLKKD